MSVSTIFLRLTDKRLLTFQEAKRYYGFLLPYASRYWKSYSVLFALMLVSVSTTLAYAWFLKGATEAAVRHEYLKLKWMLVFGATQFVVSVLVSFFNTYLRTTTTNKIKADIKVDLFSRLLNLSSTFYHVNHSGDLLSRLTNDADSAVAAIGGNLFNLIRMPLTAGVALLYLYGLNPQLSLICLLFGPFALVSAVLFSKYLRINGRLMQKKLGKINSLINEALSGNLIVRAFGLEEMIGRQYANHMDELLTLQIKNSKLSGGFRAGAQIGASMAMLFALSVGTFDVAKGQITVGSLLAFTSLMQHLVSPFTGMARQFGGIQRSLAAVERIWEIVDEPVSTGREAMPKIDSIESIDFDRVTFSYNGERRALDNVSLTVNPGQVVALVGPSGAGKSTLLRLLLGLYRPDSGSVLLNGTAIDELSRAQIQSCISYVPQDTFLFSGTIRENLLMGHSKASCADVVRAAKDAYAHEFILALPEGYDTQVGEGGVRLSGGQKQRIAIARAILKDAPILLLDEATSALDTETEYEVKQALDRLMVGRTTFVIAHRLSTVRDADVIVVMDSGRVVEKGCHEDLLTAGGLYSKLYARDFVGQ